MELFANYPSTTAASASGTTSPASGTTETWTVSSSAGFPAASSTAKNTFHIVDPALPTEIIAVTNVSGTTWTVTRGAESTTPVAHATGATYKQVVTAGYLTSLPVLIMPSGDTSGVTDTANIQNANTSLSGGGLIQLAPGAFYTTGITLSGQTTAGNSGGNPVSLRGCGPATTLFVVGSNTGISYHRTSGYGAQFGLSPTDHAIGFIRDLAIDGTNATTGAIGLDAGDGWGGVIENVFIQNFTASGCIGANLINRGLWSEKWHISLHSQNNTTAVVFDTSTGGSSLPSHEYCDITLYVFCNYGQQGVVMQNGAWFGGCSFKIRGNFGTGSAASTTAVLTLTVNNGNGVNTHIANCHMEILVESNQNNTNGPMTINFGSSSRRRAAVTPWRRGRSSRSAFMRRA